MKKSFYVVAVITLVVMGCQNEDKVASAVNKINMDVKVSRFDEAFAQAEPNDIPELRKEYPYLFPAPDSIWVAKLRDSLQIELRGEVMSEFKDFGKEIADIELLFKYIQYYFPKY